MSLSSAVANSSQNLSKVFDLSCLSAKSFSAILSLISGTYYPPRSKKILNLISRLKGKKFDKCTLGGCIVEDVDNFISVSKEQKVKKMLHQARNW